MASTNRTSASVPARIAPAQEAQPRGHVTEIQRARMIGAAIEAIQEHGYASLTVAQVIGRAKVSRKTFYDLFEDREDCFLAVLELTLARLRSRVAEACASEPSWCGRMRAGLAALLAFVDEEPALAHMCVIDSLACGPRVLSVRERVLAELRDAVDRGRDEPAETGAFDPPSVTAEAVVGAAFAVVHSRLVRASLEPYLDLHPALMSTIALPYLGPRAAGRQLRLPPPKMQRREGGRAPARDPMVGLNMRLTYRTVRVLAAIREQPHASNRQVADGAGIVDQGQISKLLARLEGLGLIENVDHVGQKGAPNEWLLTERGERVERATRPM